MILTALAFVLVLTLGLPSLNSLGSLMIVIGGSIVATTAPAWLRFLVGFTVFMAAGVLIIEVTTGGLDNARFHLGLL